MADNKQDNLFSALRRLFSTDVIIRDSGGKNLQVIDTEHIQTSGVIQTNSLIDRFHKVYTTSTAYGVNLNLAQNYQSSRVQIYADYDAMDTDAIIASALDIIADECTLKNDQGQVLHITSADENIQNLLENLFYSVMNIEFNLWSWIRNMCKYGDFYLKLEIAEKYGVYNVIPFSAYNIVRQEGFNPKNPNEVRFKFDPNAAISSTTGYTSAYNNQDPGIWFDLYEMAHFRFLGDVNYLPYGRSHIEPARKIYKQLTLMEDAMLIHRIMRAPEKRMFYVNVGSIPPNEVEQFMQKTINSIKKTPYVDPQTGEYNLRFNMMNMMEDFYLPVRGGDTSTRIETTKGLEYDGTNDVEYLRDKMFAALKVPKAYFGYEKDLSGKATLASEDIRFARSVERIQRILESELTKIGLVHLYAQGFKGESLTNFEIKLTTPSIIYEQEKVALLKEKIDLARQMQETKLFSTDYIYDHIFNLSEDTYNEMRDLVREDAKREFRISQIENEGNDPVISGQSFGTPHDLASIYGSREQGDVPSGYDERDANPEGRPRVKASILGTQQDPAGGRDRLGVHGMKGGYPSDAENVKESTNNTKVVFLRNKDIFAPKKTIIFEEAQPETSDLLNEDNIQDLDN